MKLLLFFQSVPMISTFINTLAVSGYSASIYLHTLKPQELTIILTNPDDESRVTAIAASLGAITQRSIIQ